MIPEVAQTVRNVINSFRIVVRLVTFQFFPLVAQAKAKMEIFRSIMFEPRHFKVLTWVNLNYPFNLLRDQRHNSNVSPTLPRICPLLRAMPTKKDLQRFASSPYLCLV
jgi:hypothetical protein